MLQLLDKRPEEKLSYGLLMDLQDRRDRAVLKAKNEYKEYKDTQRSEDEEIDLRLPRKPRKKRKKLHGQRRPMDTSEDLHKPRKKKRIKAPDDMAQAAAQNASEKADLLPPASNTTNVGGNAQDVSGLEAKIKEEKIKQEKQTTIKTKREVVNVKTGSNQS
eukprot:TRINITY_DN2350_c0_g1_i2.p1 TRINITY_DN2350_c0_g1~~TRINITY_DN2350_c0_g1_i2.p1  ORF type:complete len:161 (+),score=39.94 TRINITY_DN2350_c0_g1_i2:96-578(+)